MIPCPYCGGSSELRRYQIDAPNCRQSLYRVTCTRCGASTEDSLAKSSVFSKWNRGEVLKMTVIDEKRQRYTEIDGRKLIVDGCCMCPYLEESDDRTTVYCDYPWNGEQITISAERLKEIRIEDGCPLREVWE